MSEPDEVRSRLEQPLRLFLLCLAAALLAHVLTVFVLRNQTFFGMATIREGARRLFRVPVQEMPPARPRTRPLQVPDRADVIAAVERSVAGAVSDALADLPPVTLAEPPPGAGLEEFARTREAEDTPPQAAAPTHLDAVEAAAAAVGRGAVRERVEVVARQVKPLAGGAAIGAATAAALRRSGPPTTVAVPGRVGPRARPALPASPRASLPRLAPIAAPPPREVRAEPETRRLLDPALADRVEAWDPYFDFALTVYRPPTGEPGYFRLEVVPKRGAPLPVAARDVLFILDASKSMGEERFGAAQAVIAAAIAALPERDRFTVLAFQSKAVWWRQTMQPASRLNRQAAGAWVKGLESEGRTDLYAGLAPAMAAIQGGSRPVVVLLCSDGRPTAGERDSRVLINELTAQLGGRASIFAYGAGSNVNRYLLDLLTYRNRGAGDFGTRPRDMGPGLAAMERSIRRPVYLRLEILIGGAVLDSVYPRPLPDIYAERPTRVWGRLAPGATHLGVQLLGWSQGEPREILAEVAVPPADTGTATLAQEWAQQRLLFLVDEITAYGDDPVRMAEVAQLGRDYPLLKEYIEAARGR